MNFTREPVVLIGAIVTVIEMAIGMLIALGVIVLTLEQVGAIMAFVVAVGGLVTILLIRPKVTPVADPRNNEGTSLVPFTDV